MIWTEIDEAGMSYAIPETFKEAQRLAINLKDGAFRKRHEAAELELQALMLRGESIRDDKRAQEYAEMAFVLKESEDAAST